MIIYIALILSVIVGLIVAFGLKLQPNKLQLLLSFSGAYLLAITIIHLLPEVVIDSHYSANKFILVGVLLQIILDFFSKGAEHGHIHVQEKKELPWALFISLSIHAFMEGIPLGHTNHEHLLWAIVVHKVPIAIILATFLVNSKFSNKITALILIVFSLISPLGSLAGKYIPFLITYKSEITAIVIGVLLHVSTIILFETSKNHKFNILKFTAIIAGMAVAFLA